MSCPDCFQGHVHDGEPRGALIKLHGLDTYVAEPPEGRAANGIIVIIPDAFGLNLVNNKLLADSYAEKGDYRVYLPDFMHGTATPVWLFDCLKIVVNKGSIFSKMYQIPWILYGFVPWVYHNRIARSYPVVKAFFTALRQAEGASLPVGAAGFCWGGKHTVLLAGDPAEVNGKRLFDAGFTAHPSFLDFPSDIEKMTLPVSFAIGDQDNQVPLDKIPVIEKVVEAQPDEYRGEILRYDNCGHGFGIRADPLNTDVVKQAAAAEDQCIRWFKKHFGASPR